MDLFCIVEDAEVILYSKGLYRQTTVYQRGAHYYAKVGSGYARLLKHETTSIPSIRWIDGVGFPLAAA